MIRTVSVLISILRVKDINIVKIFAAPVVVIPDAANLGLIMCDCRKFGAIREYMVTHY